MMATGFMDEVAHLTPALPELSFRLLEGDASFYAGLTFAGLAQQLVSVPEGACAVGVHNGIDPVALALGEISGKHACLRSIFVAPAWRKRGVGVELLRLWEQAASCRGAESASVRYTDGLPQLAQFGSLLQRSGWSEPQLTHCRLAGFAGSMARGGGAWAGAGRVLRNQSIAYAPLVFSADDEASIEHLLALPEAHHTLDPRRLLSRHIAELSCAIRRGDELVGWMIAIPGAKSIAAACGVPTAFIAEYTELFLDPPLWKLCVALGAFHEIFLRQAEFYGEDSIATYQTFPGRREMMAFTLRRFAPMAKTLRRLYRCEKRLVATAEEPV